MAFDPFESGQATPVDEAKPAGGFDPFAGGQATPVDTPRKGPTDTSVDLSPMQRVGAALLGPAGLPYALSGKRPTGLGIDLALEAGIPATLQALTTEFSPVVQSGIGAIASGLGNILAQGRRLISGEQSGFSPGQVAASTATGAIPFAGPAANAERLGQFGLMQILKDAGIEGVKLGAVAASGEAVKTLVDEGRMPRLDEAGVPTLISAGAGTAIGGIRSAANAYRTAGMKVAENAADYSAVNHPPTPGMLLPDQLASSEQRAARANPTGPIAQSIDEVKGALTSGMQNVAPNPPEGAALFKQVSPIIGQISSTEAELGKLSGEAKAANEDAYQALADLGQKRAIRQATDNAAAQKTLTQQTKIADKVSQDAYTAQIKSVNKNAQDLALTRMIGGDEAIDPALNRDLAVEHVVKPTMAAKENYFAQQYSLVDNQARVFDTRPILDAAEEQASSLTGNIPRKANAAIAQVKNNLSGILVSLQDLRNTRSEILRTVRMGDFESDADERIAKGIASEITKQINAQATSALGEEAGNILRKTNSEYSAFSNAMDAPGVNAIFSKKPSDDYVRGVVSDMQKNGGVNADSYKNLQNVIDQVSGFKFNTPETGPAMQQGNELAANLRAHVQDMLKSSILYDSSQNIDGKLVVNGQQLSENLDKIAKTPGTAERLGFGGDESVTQLRKLFRDYADASKLDKSDMEDLFNLPAFKAASLPPAYGGAGPIVPIETLRSKALDQLKNQMADSQANNLLLRSANLKAAGAEEAAKATYQRAVATAQSVDGDLAALRSKYESLLQDPVAIAFNNPNLPKSGFNAFASALFDPAANKLENKEVGDLVNALRTSPNPQNQQMLKQLQSRYIEDKISAYQSTNKSTAALNSPDTNSIALFFSPANPSDAANEIERAKTLLDPEQFAALSEFSKTAKAISRYEKIGSAGEEPGKYTIPIFGRIRRGIESVADLVRDGQYGVASKLLADPAQFSASAQMVGDAANNSIPAFQKAAVGAGRTYADRQKQRQRNR